MDALITEIQTCSISGSCSLMIIVSKGAPNRRCLVFCREDTPSLPCRFPLYQDRMAEDLKVLRKRGCWGVLWVSAGREGGEGREGGRGGRGLVSPIMHTQQ